MDTTKIVIETEQSCSMTYHLTIDELEELTNLIMCGGKAVISGHHLEARGDHLYQYKNKDFQGANYAMPVAGVLSMLKAKLFKCFDE